MSRNFHARSIPLPFPGCAPKLENGWHIIVGEVNMLQASAFVCCVGTHVCLCVIQKLLLRVGYEECVRKKWCRLTEPSLWVARYWGFLHVRQNVVLLKWHFASLSWAGADLDILWKASPGFAVWCQDTPCTSFCPAFRAFCSIKRVLYVPFCIFPIKITESFSLVFVLLWEILYAL